MKDIGNITILILALLLQIFLICSHAAHMHSCFADLFFSLSLLEKLRNSSECNSSEIVQSVLSSGCFANKEAGS